MRSVFVKRQSAKQNDKKKWQHRFCSEGSWTLQFVGLSWPRICVSGTCMWRVLRPMERPCGAIFAAWSRTSRKMSQSVGPFWDSWRKLQSTSSVHKRKLQVFKQTFLPAAPGNLRIDLVGRRPEQLDFDFGCDKHVSHQNLQMSAIRYWTNWILNGH